MREVLCGLVIGLCVGVPIGAWFCERLRMKAKSPAENAEIAESLGDICHED